MPASSYTFLRFEVRDHIAHVTFDSPDTENKYSKEQEQELFDALDEIQTDPDIRVVVVAAEGEVFGGGSSRRGDYYVAADYYERALSLFDEWSRTEKPIIVALNGPGLLTLPLLSDIVIAEEQVELRDNHVLVGVPSATGSFLWPMSVGMAKARRYLLTGDALSATEAERIGLISEVVPQGKSNERAVELAVQIAALEPVGVQMTKRALNEWVRASWGPIFKHALGLEFVHFPAETYNARIREADSGH
jgi:enoyl-CoA hydratase